ncbi:phosphoglucomutase/phosphomannomutase family protein [Bacteroidetes/Chlorobi group bacterium MS-B_bin-24]|jgi:phosphomannomutase|nr:MAG: phosphoglucomutase/phosphomannomutase family protein [Bacteroidetes/Chlorobi group bacterium MS-B_bin-24]
MIVFGTDGWRGEIARDFTFDNLYKVALATVNYLKSLNKPNISVVIGYDTRFLSKEFALETALILASNGIVAHLTNTFAATPIVSFHTKQKGSDLGIVITASHNPPNYNGYKIKGRFGGPAPPEEIQKVEAELHKITRVPKFKFKPLDVYIGSRLIRPFDAREPYIRYVKKKIDIDLIRSKNYKILYDPMYGAGMGILKTLLPNIEEIHNEFNPSFGDLHHPEPVPENLHTLIDKIKLGKYDIGLATDGDADRLGVVDSEGNFIDSHRIFMIILKYLHEIKGKKAPVAKTVSLTSMVNKYCEKNGLTLYETPVGFKHIAKLMAEEKILIGGEESGGLGTILHIPERDGIFNALLLLEIMAKRKKSIKELSDELDKEFGPHRYWRRDVKVTEQEKRALLRACAKMPTKIGKYLVKRIDTKDGYKFYLEDGWLLIRPSGTEPLIRFYAEASSMSIVNEVLENAMKLLK